MPAITHAELALDEPSSTYHYISASHICAGLTILSLVAILLHAVSQSKPRNEDINKSQKQGQACDHLDHLVSQQRLHNHFFHDRVWTMEEKSRGVSSDPTAEEGRVSSKPSSKASFPAGIAKEADGDGQNESSGQTPSTGNPFSPRKDLNSTRFMLSRPPPPPLTPPELSPSVFIYDDRRRSFTGMGSAQELDASFFEQPNPDYMSSTETEAATTTATQSKQIARSSPTPRRRSYTKTMPIGVPISATSPVSDEAGVTFSPSSYPPTSPSLPGPPPIHGELLEDGTFRKIHVQGEIISLLDGSGAGWKRHTRVYGGGVCLACEASGEDGHHGGFYGENVLPEEKRY
ncbi:hypothetical protein CkaCkLH20_01650 [Colletotrichum karsti]|uniref:Uncharacterized protein n=1 Tax=Colletotrichum karsti TaxID=1095194 RepID=A0A9P6ID24_9PEZI|nr:uncharacterized protein CkaCkLH20_01650 [Colletotrichum karsti]KAF9880608.1 hypothetical protein CkaCkLH20_01650 [Colletotrichum karsti]